MTYSGALILTEKGHKYVGRPTDGEVYLSMEQATEELGTELAEELIASMRAGVDTLGVSGVVLQPGQVPGRSYYVGDRIDGRLVQSIAVKMRTGAEAEAAADISLELGDRTDQSHQDIQRRIERASRGVRSPYASPTIGEPYKGKGDDKRAPFFSLGQTLYPSETPWWRVEAPFVGVWLEATLTDAGRTDSMIRLYQNNWVRSELWIRAGEKRATIKLMPEKNGLHYATNDVVITEIVHAGEDAANLAVRVIGAYVGDDI